MPFLLINKPAKWTSHDIVARLRRITGEKTIGHAGTLDPFATGLLIIAIGRDATRKIDQFKALEKEYEVVMRFGATSDTQDSDGQMSPHPYTEPVTLEQLQETTAQFVGAIEQIPPMFSAKKVQGKKLYELARQGITIERKPAAIHISAIDILSCDTKQARLRVVCSPGTYIRTLVQDIGEQLGCGAYADTLARTRIGTYALSAAHEIDSLTKDSWHAATFVLQSN